MLRFTSTDKWAVGFLVASALAIAACSTTGSVGAEVETLGVSGGFGVGWGEDSATLDAPGSATLDVQWRDSSLNPIGSPVTGVGQGDVVMIPNGAVGFTASTSSSSACTGCAVDNLVTPPARRQAVIQSFQPVSQTLMFFPVKAQTVQANMGPLSNTYASFSFAPTLTPLTHEELVGKVAAILLAPIWSLPPVAPDTTVNFYTKAVPDAYTQSGRVFVAAQTIGFDSYMLKLNGTVLSTLGYHSDLHPLANGWQVIESRLTQADFEGDGSEYFELVADTIEGDANGLAGLATYQPQ